MAFGGAAKGRTDYTIIQRQVKKTLVKAMVLGSVKENWFRDLLNAHLAQVLPSDVEYMVGLQKRHALRNGREIDIRAVSQQILSRIRFDVQSECSQTQI